MKIVDGQCPYCSSPIEEKPGKVKKDISCGSCGRILTLLPEAHDQTPVDVDGFKTLEPGLIISFLISVVIAFDAPFITAVFAVSGFLLMTLLYTNERIPGLSGDMKNRVSGSSARLKVFPFELYLVPIWGALVILQLFGFHFLKVLIVSLMMMLSALMAIQANRLYLDKKIKTSDLSLSDFSTFLNILINPQTAFEKKKYEGVQAENQSQELFSKAAAKKQEIDQQKEDELMSDELQEKKNLCSMERKRWEEDMMNRYNSWLKEESARLISERC